MSEAKEQDWVSVQKRTFGKWVNNNLKKKGYEPIEGPLEGAWADGIKLMELLNALFDVPVPKHNKNPRMRPQLLDNLAQAFKMFDVAEVKTNFLKPHQLMDKDEKMILGMVWAIILDYAIKGISEGEATAKEGLLLWVQKKTKGYRDVDPPTVTNFTTCWKNGMAFCALIHRHEPSLIPYDSLDKANAAENLELAFRVAEEHLDIPRLLEVEDLTEAVRPDERSVMTYVSEFFHRFASYAQKENAARRVANFLKFARDIQARQDAYEARARELIAWTQTQVAEFQGRQFEENIADAVAALDAFRAYLTEHKPVKLGEKLDIDTLFAELMTQLLVNNRPAYVPPEDCSPDAIGAAFASLAQAEADYGARVRDNRFRFIERKETHVSEEVVAEIRESFNHFDHNGSGDLDRIEFKAALTALGVPFKDDAAVDAIFAEVSGGEAVITFEQWMQYNQDLAEDKDTPEQVLASFKSLAGDEAFITADQLRMPPLEDDDVTYLQQVMPANEDGTLDYTTFVTQSYNTPAAE